MGKFNASKKKSGLSNRPLFLILLTLLLVVVLTALAFESVTLLWRIQESHVFVSTARDAALVLNPQQVPLLPSETSPISSATKETQSPKEKNEIEKSTTTTTADPLVSGGNPKYLVYFPCGGLITNRLSALSAIMIAHNTNSTLVLPMVPVRTSMCRLGAPCKSFKDSLSWTKNVKDFDYLYDSDHFQKHLKDVLGVQTVSKLPECLQNRLHANEVRIHYRHLNRQNLQHRRPQLFPPPNCNEPNSLDSNQKNLCDQSWHSECNAHLLVLDCPYRGYIPVAPSDWTTYKDAFESFRPNSEIRDLVQEAKSHLTNNGQESFWTLHLRIEDDQSTPDLTMYPNHWKGTFWRFSDHLKSYNIPQKQKVFLCVGRDPEDEVMLQFFNHPKIQELNLDFVMIETLPESLREKITKEKDMEFRAAFSYQLSLEANVHVGPLFLGFDGLLAVERILQSNGANDQSFDLEKHGASGHEPFFGMLNTTHLAKTSVPLGNIPDRTRIQDGYKDRYVTYHPCGGLNNNRASAYTALMIAYYTNATMVMNPVPVRGEMCIPQRPCPSFNNHTVWWSNLKPLEYMFDRDKYMKIMNELGIRVVTELPPCLAQHMSKEKYGPIHTDIAHLNSLVLPTRNPELFPPVECDSQSCKKTWYSECQAHLFDLDCGLFGFTPISTEEWKLYRKVYDAMDFSPSLYSLVGEAKNHLMGDHHDTYWCLHLRIEDDWSPAPLSDENAWQRKFSEFAKKLGSLGLPENEPVFVSVALPLTDQRLVYFFRNPDIKSLKANFTVIETFPEKLQETLNQGHDMEFRAAFALLLCRESTVHVGSFDSSFDATLAVERHLFGDANKKTIDLFGTGGGNFEFLNGLLES